MDGRDRSALDHIHQRTPLRWAQQEGRTWCPAVGQAVRALRIEAHHPVPDDLQAHPANPGSIAAQATFIDRSQSQEPPSLIGITRLPSVAA
jgi:hypothetical protein